MTVEGKKVREIMIDVFEFPHVPYWFTIRQVSGILKKSISGSKCPRPLITLVFDEKYNLLGHIDVQDILHGIVSSLSPEGGMLSSPDAETIRLLGELSEKPASTLMHEAKLFVDPEDPLSKAGELLLRNDLSILPVLEAGKKLVGIVRSTEIFEYVSALYFKT